MLTTTRSIVLTDGDYRVLGEEDFGVEGLIAHEWIGPFVEVQAIGPLIMVHDGRFDPRKGIGHHPHRYNERLFYILDGTVDHDDSLNGITGHMGTGDLGILTEGRRGMLHQEWNNTDGPGRAFILVYGTDPMPPAASFAAVRDADAPRTEPLEGVRSKEIIGPNVDAPLHGDIRGFTDDELQPGAELPFELGPQEGALVFPLEGETVVDGEPMPIESMALYPPNPAPRTIAVSAPHGARVLRVIHGPGYGLLLRSMQRS
jgi:redox-sensitive bicupin YhaK (pirin superfamily)